MSPELHALTNGMPGLVFGYATVAIPLLVGLIKGGAPIDKILWSPVFAIALTIAAGIGFSILYTLLPFLNAGGENIFQVILGVLGCATLGYKTGRFVAAGKSSGSFHRRGAIVSALQALSGREVSRDPATVTLAGVPLTLEDETKHFKLIGTTGTGKSTAIREMLSVALARGDRAIIADPDGGYLGSFYNADRGDVILNPFEDDALKWNLFGEITNDYDVDQLARSLIPDGTGEDRSWGEYARTFFIAVTQQAIAAGIRDDAELYRLLHVAPIGDLRILLAGTAAGPFLEEGNERMFGSVRSITSSAVRPLKYTTRQRATPFSVREWVKHGAARNAGGRGGVLFLPYKAGEIAALRSMISAWMRIAIFEAMGRSEGDQRLWFVVDELDALGEIDGLKDALARLRKFGGRCVLGFQSIAQVSNTYGRGAADTIVENCGNTLILRCSASERGGTSEFASKLIGQREVVHTTRSRTRAPDAWRASTTDSEHVKIEPAVMASQIERLPDLEGFLKVASIADWQHVRITPVSYPRVERRKRGGGAEGAPESAGPAPRGMVDPVAAVADSPGVATTVDRAVGSTPAAARSRGVKPRAVAVRRVRKPRAAINQPALDNGTAVKKPDDGGELRD